MSGQEEERPSSSLPSASQPPLKLLTIATMSSRVGIAQLSYNLIANTRTTLLQPTLRTTGVILHRSLHSTPLRLSSLHQQAALSSTCPSCHAPLPSQPLTPICPSCSALLPPPPPSTTSFTLFNLPQSYALDAAALKRTFLQLQQKVHPDLFSGEGEKESWAKAWSGRVNDAYKVLQGERSRGEYLVRSSLALFSPCARPPACSVEEPLIAELLADSLPSPPARTRSSPSLISQ